MMNVHPEDALKFRIFLDIYPDTGVVFFKLSSDMVQMLQFVSGHLPRQQGWYFQVLVHLADAPEILHLPGTFTWTRGLFYFWVFRTLHHADALVLLRTFTQTGVVFFGFSAHYMISVRRSSSLDWKKDRNRTEPNRKRPDHRLRLPKF